VYRISGSASIDAVRVCLRRLKDLGHAEQGAERGKWRISEQGLAMLAEESVKKLAEEGAEA
jgi:hypothetical protein